MAGSGTTTTYHERRLSAQDGLQLYYRDYGDPLSPGIPLLCLTGLTRNSQDYADLAERFAGSRRVICPDYRGRGRSAHDPNWRNYDPMTYLGDIGHILMANDIHRVIIVGTSLGGLLWWERFARATYHEGADGALHFDWDIALVEPLKRSNGEIQDLWPFFRALRNIPTLLVRGEISDVLTTDGLRRMIADKPDLIAVTVPGIGHTPSLDEPEIRDVLDDFIARF